MRRSIHLQLAAMLAVAACVGQVPGGDDTGGGGADAAGGGDTDGGGPGAPDGGGVPQYVCERPVQVPLAGRPLDIMPASRLGDYAARIPCTNDPGLRALLESTDTMWYDHASIIPGYQDSFGDNVIAPIGMRPNTIASNLIDLAVPGGHAQIFIDKGVFHFPFGRPAGFHEDDAFVIDFWQLPRDGGGALRPVVYWQRDPNELTHRVEWMFPRGTVFGEVLFLHTGETYYPFEIRTRTRELDRWVIDVYRPFATAGELADALERKRAGNPAWAASAELDALIAHLRDDGTLQPASLAASHFASAFPQRTGAEDVLPGLTDNTILHELLLETPFSSVKDGVWKQSGSLRAYGATTDAAYSIVPRGYNGGLIAIDDDSCESCHRDAGRPFKDWYDNILAYGELWGEDETFSWHPFEAANFVDGSGAVVNFNYDNRVMREDFVAAGVIAPYDENEHPATVYARIIREWTNYAY